MTDLFTEIGYSSINKHDEPLCGDFYTVTRSAQGTTIVLSDGLGSGVKANILATLTAKILSTLTARGLPIEECVYTMATTLPVCSVRRLAYSTFTILKLGESEAYLAQFDNPSAVILRQGKCLSYPSTRLTVGDKEIYESRVPLEEGDMIVLMTDGVTSAGLGKRLPGGWGADDVSAFLERWYAPDLSAQGMAAALTRAAYTLSQECCDDDTTAIAVKLRRRQAVNVMLGPPRDRADDEKILRLFFSLKGRHVVCGGTTAHAVSKFLDKPIRVLDETGSEDTPPAASIQGVDLVTEGVITLGRVTELAEAYLKDTSLSLEIRDRNDAAALLAKMLFEEATDITVFFGQAVNSAHADACAGADIDFSAKRALLRRLEDALVRMGKRVKISMC